MVGHERHQDCSSHRCPSFADLFSFALRSMEMPQNQTERLKLSSCSAKGKFVPDHDEIAPAVRQSAFSVRGDTILFDCRIGNDVT